MQLPSIADRVSALNQPTTRTHLITEAKATGFVVKTSMLHPMGREDSPNFDLDRVASLQQIVEREGKGPVDVYIERLLASEGREFYNYWAFWWRLGKSMEIYAARTLHPHVGGCWRHIGFFTDADSPTFLLSELTRKRGVYTLPEAVHRITGQSAAVLGLKERELLREGWHADINVINYASLDTRHPYYVNDIPYNGGRFIVESQGYVATIVGGQPIIENGVHTGQRPGQVIREFQRS